MDYGWNYPFKDFTDVMGRIGSNVGTGVKQRRLSNALSTLGPDADWNAIAKSVMDIDPQLGLKLKIEGMQADKPIRWGVNPVDGSFFNPENPTQTIRSGATNPYFTGKQTPDQAKAADHASIAAEAYRNLAEIGDINKADEGYPLSRAAQILPDSGWGGALKDYASTDKRQRYNNATRVFVNALNRRESGAEVKQSEIDEALRNYIELPTDKPELKAQKARNRQIKMQGLFAAAGPNFTPPSLDAPSAPPPPAGETPTLDANPEYQADMAAGRYGKRVEPAPEHKAKLEALLAQYPDPKDQAEIMAEWEKKYPQYGRGAADYTLGRDVQAGR
jgi:hypothetical protein